MLDKLQQHWDNKTLDYELEKYNFPKWAMDVIREEYPQVTELEKIHEVLSPTEIVKLQMHVQNACQRKDFMQMFDDFAQEYVPPLIDNRKFMVQRQGTLRVVIPNQAKVGRRLNFHQGVFVGNGRGCRTIWTPMTKAEKTNTMWIMDLATSREITKRHISEQWSQDKFEQECIKNAWPVTLKPGQSHLFFQEHLHGNVNNEENYTRVSLDMRILIEGEEYGRRLPGGFMRFLGDHRADEVLDYTDKKFITYAGWSSNFSKNIPLPMQRSVIENYCIKNKISYSSYEFENEHCDWQPNLESYIKLKPEGIVLCSMYSLTDDKDRRNEILEMALANNVELHFANELCYLKTREDLAQIDAYMNFAVAQKGKHSWENY